MWPGIVAKSYLAVLLGLTLLYAAVAVDQASTSADLASLSADPVSVDVDPVSQCPPKESVEPCLCYKACKDCFSNIICEDIRRQELLYFVLDQSRDYQYESFTLNRASVRYIPDYLFSVRKLHILKVLESSMEELFSLSGIPIPFFFLRYIHLENVQLRRRMKWEQFSRFSNLEKLIIFHTNVSKIDQTFVEFAPKSLKELNFNKCSTSKIHDEAFAALQNLLEVHVLNGKIKEVKRSMFPKPSKLQWFSFSGNQLSSLPEDIFSEMPDLKYIFLEGNLLKELPENTFGHVFPNLKALHFEGNPLKCRCNIRWITTSDKKMDRQYLLGSCQEPKNLYGKQIRDLVPENFLHC